MRLLCRLRRHALVVLVLAVYIVTAGWLVFEMPGFVPPNEGLHYEYVALLRLTGRLPDTGSSRRADERHQPPVYYTISALLSLPFGKVPLDGDFDSNPFYISTHRGNLNAKLNVIADAIPALFVMRAVSLLFGALGVIAIYASASPVLSRSASVLAAAFAAFQPMYLFLSAAGNNDLAVAAMSACLLALSTFLLMHPRRPAWYALWGLLFSLAMLTKATAIFLLLLLPVMCFIRWRQERSLRRTVTCGAVGVAAAAPLWGAWLIFNAVRGTDTFGVAASVPVNRLITLRPVDFMAMLPQLEHLFRSFWLDWSPGEYGYAPTWVYVAALVFIVLTGAGWLLTWKRDPKLGPLLALHLAWSAAACAIFLSVKTLMTRDTGFLVPEGRWLLLVVPSLAWFVAAGWAHWEWLIPTQLSYVPTLLVVGTSLFLVFWLQPRLMPQAQKLTSPQAIPATAVPAHLTYGDRFELLASEGDAETVGQESNVYLYWHAVSPVDRDYTVSAQLLVPHAGSWVKLDEQNSYPGNGLNRTSRWQYGDTYRDQVVLNPNGALNGPTRALLGVWVLYPDTRPLSVTQDQKPMTSAIAREIVVRPLLPLRPDDSALLSAPVDFSSQFKLVGVATTAASNMMTVTLWWNATDEVTQDYTVFVHLLDSRATLLAQNDSPPDGGNSPTHIWRTGDVVQDVHAFHAVPATDAILEIGVYDPVTFARPSVEQNGHSLPDNVFRLPVAHLTP